MVRYPRLSPRRTWTVIGVAVLTVGACNAAPQGEVAAPQSTVASEPPATTAPVVATTAAVVTTPAPAPTVPALTSRLAVATTDLATQLIDVEQAIRQADAPVEALRTAGELQQLIYRRLGRDPAEWAAVAPLLPPDVVGPATLNVEAATALAVKATASTAPAATTLPAWTIAEPLPAATLIAWYREAEAATGVPWSLLAAINLAETRMGRIVGVSSAGAVGPMQFLPSTWEECCVGDPTDTHDAIIGAATYLAWNGAPGDLAKAVRRYNPNDAYIASVLAYAANMAADERAYLGYHGWQVFVGSVAGSLRLPVGYAATERVDAAAYVAAHPEDRVG